MLWRMALTPAVCRPVPIECHGGSIVVRHVRCVSPGSDGEGTPHGMALFWAECLAALHRSDIPPGCLASLAVVRASGQSRRRRDTAAFLPMQGVAQRPSPDRVLVPVHRPAAAWGSRALVAPLAK